jgi:hypothetical protein
MSLQKNHKRFQSEEQVFTLILGEPEELWRIASFSVDNRTTYKIRLFFLICFLNFIFPHFFYLHSNSSFQFLYPSIISAHPLPFISFLAPLSSLSSTSYFPLPSLSFLFSFIFSLFSLLSWPS